MSRTPLTQAVHNALLTRISSTMIAIDATAGNGFDTLFLASHLSKGHLYAFDIQQQAIDQTQKRLNKAGLAERVTLICDGHEVMRKRIPEVTHGKVDIILFNLGYLPRTDKSIITQQSTTLQALNSAIGLLSANGYISVLAYPGHPGGREETEAVKSWARNLPEKFNVQIHLPEYDSESSPEWIEIISTSE